MDSASTMLTLPCRRDPPCVKLSSSHFRVAGAADFPKHVHITTGRLQTDGEFRGLVEFSPHFSPRPQVSHVLFDFDGTLSLIRQGWPEVMIPMFAEMLPRRPGESDEAVRQL